MKKALLILLFPSVCFGADQWFNMQKDVAGPLEMMETNTSASNQAMTEMRVLNNAGCANDLGVSGSNYSADSTLYANEAFLIGESTCAGMLIKQNSNSYIRFSLGTSPSDKLKIEPNKATFTGSGAESLLVNGTLGRFEILSDGNDYDVFAGNVNSNAFHLMVGRNAKVTINPNGSVELWPSTCQAPTHGGVTLCVESGKLKAVTAAGTTVLAQ